MWTMSRPKGSVPSPESELSTEHLDAELGKRSRRGGLVLLLAQALRVAGQFATLIVLARLLPPSAFGLLAMIGAIGLVLDMVKELGLSSASIQKPDLTHAQVSALFWINAAAGVGLGMIFVAAAPLLAGFYRQPELADVARWMALGLVMSGLTVQHWALLRRQMRFGAIAGLETTADYVGFAVAIAVAVAGEGYWALVAQRLVSPAVLMGGSWLVCSWRPGLPAKAAGLGDLLRYGLSVMASGLAGALTRSIDQIMIGWLWGAPALGFYERTSRLLQLPVNTINAPVYAAGMPALSRLAEQPDRYRRMFCQILQKLAMLTMPPFAVAAVNADWVVEILLGPAWREAVPLAALFAVSATFLPVLLTVGLLYLTQNRTRELLRATTLDASLCLAAIGGGLPWGGVGVAGALAIVGLALRTPLAFWLATRHGPVRTQDIWRAIAPAIAAGLASGGTAWLVRLQEPHEFSLSGAVTVAAASMFATVAVLWAWPETRREIRSAAGRVTILVRRRRAVLEP